MADNVKLKTLASRFRRSEQFAANKTVDFLGSTFAGSKIAVLNKIQMSKGKDSNDNELGNYSKRWADYRESRSKQTEFIDLEFTGKFYDSIKVEGRLISAKRPEIIFDADKERLDNLSVHKNLDYALGLSQENRDKVAMMIATHIQKELLNYYKV